MSELRLSRRADWDLFEIFVRGVGTFGFEQATRYRDELKHCCELLLTNPGMGRPYVGAGGNARRHEHARHVIFYEPAPYGVLILSIQHVHAMPRNLRDWSS